MTTTRTDRLILEPVPGTTVHTVDLVVFPADLRVGDQIHALGHVYATHSRIAGRMPGPSVRITRVAAVDPDSGRCRFRELQPGDEVEITRTVTVTIHTDPCPFEPGECEPF